MKSNKRKTISMKKIFYYVMALALGCSQMSCSDLLDQKARINKASPLLTKSPPVNEGFDFISSNTSFAL